MTITIESTDRVVDVNGVPARIWEGETTSGVRVQCMVTRIAVKNGQDCSQFERELQEHRPPSAETVAAFPLRMVL